ncbi:MAG: hypothetical protein M3O26_15655 [Pseudomonadota bacterium]|nr:hypothetical protein [Pseudomonadota bacterium]
MSGYTPLFSTLTEGTLYGKWPHTGIWACLLSMVDQHGTINRNPQMIANAVGVPIEQLLACISDFMSPDPASQSQENEGRRLELIDPAREWGWKVINSGKYREKARLMGKAKRESETGENAARLRDRRGPPKNAAKRPSDIDLNKDREGLAPPVPKTVKPKPAKRAPRDFIPDPSVALAKLPNVDVEAEVRKFLDWEFKTARSDWPAVWRTWVQNASERGQYAKIKTNGDWSRIT